MICLSAPSSSIEAGIFLALTITSWIHFRLEFANIIFFFVFVRIKEFRITLLRGSLPSKLLMSLSVIRVSAMIGRGGFGGNLFFLLSLLWFGGYCLINSPQTTNLKEGIMFYLPFVVFVQLKKKIQITFSLSALMLHTFGVGCFKH